MSSRTASARTAMTTILTADATLKTLLGGIDGRITRYKPFTPEQQRLLTYYFLDTTPAAMQSDDVMVQFDAWLSPESGALEAAEGILERVHALLTNPNFKTQNVDAWAFRISGPHDGPTGKENIIRLMSEYRIHVS